MRPGPTAAALIAARAAAGVGAAALVPCSLALLRQAYPAPGERARAVGIWAACASVALSAGPLVGALLVETLGWRAIFLVNAPLGAAGIVLALRHAVDTPRTPRRIDLPGQALAAVALCALAAATIGAGESGFGSGAVLAGYAVTAAAVGAFVLVEARRRAPMLPLALFRSRTFTAMSGIGLLINVCFYGLIFVLSLFLQTVRGLSVLGAGLAFLPTTAAVFAGNVAAGRLVRRPPRCCRLGRLLAAGLAGCSSRSAARRPSRCWPARWSCSAPGWACWSR